MTPTVAKDAIVPLMADQAAARRLVGEFEKRHSVADTKAFIADICTALSLHAQIEEEIFYPAVKAALNDKQLLQKT